MSTKTIPLGPRLGLIFAEIGDELNTVPDDAQREVNDLLNYVDGRTMIEKLAGFLVSKTPMPEDITDPEPVTAEVLNHNRELVSLDMDDEATAHLADATEPQEPEPPADAPASETAPTSPPAPPKPKRKSARPKATSPTVAG